jgi:hypothetical protein
MRTFFVGALVAGSLLVPASAVAGGWATAGISPSKPPAGTGPGDSWTVTIKVDQHGETPLAGASPALILTNADSGERIDFPAKATDTVGLYRATATIPGNGTWKVSVYDGFEEYGGAQTHTFAPITIGPVDAPAASASEKARPAPASDGFPAWPVALAVLALMLGTGVVALARRSRKKAPAIV